MKKKVLNGMSGGVDSSTAAYLLKEQGYEVSGCLMKLWGEHETAIRDAANICEKLGIDFHVFDCRKEFQESVISYFIEEYKNGRTPNPCIMCNKKFKFGMFLDKADELGMDYIATGHYARILKNENTGLFELSISDALKKDQSYFLYNFTQKQLSRTLMPLGDYSKPQIREIAEKIGIDTANKPDSQEICFVEDGDYAKFIEDFSNYLPTPGKIYDVNNNVLGEHKGLIYYTIGQRKGIGAYGRPMFVMKINPADNSIVLGEKGMEFSSSLIAEDLNFISGKMPTEPISILAKARYQATPCAATLTPIDNNTVRIDFSEPQRAITPGQAVVFYLDNTVLGGGTINIF